jgi:uncharacterized repeat protein (TIGR02543 family)
MKGKRFIQFVISTWILQSQAYSQTVSISGAPSPVSGGTVSYPGYFGLDTTQYPPTTITDSNNSTYGLWFSSTPSVYLAQTVYLYATPITGYSFTGWTGDANGTVNPLAVTANSDLNISANFELLSYAVSAQTVGEGNLTGTGIYSYGSQASLSASPEANSSFLGWDSYDSSIANWTAASGSGSLDESSQKSVTVYEETYLNGYFSPNVYPTDSNLTDSLKAYLSSYPDTLYFSGVPIGNSPDQLTEAHLESISAFTSSGNKISSLEGLQYAKNLSSLTIRANAVQDLSPLWSLSSLSYLDLSEGGSITSLEGIANLPVLTYLYLDGHRISSITPLIDLPYLYHLKIKRNFLDLSDLTVQTEIYNLRSRFVTVEIERQVPKPIQDLPSAMETQKAQLIASPTDAQANFVFALELLLNLLEDNGSRSLKSLAVSLGASETIRSFSLPDFWLEELNYGNAPNPSFDYGEVETYLEKTLLKTLEIADLHLSRINDTSTYITLTQDLTGLEQVIYADIGDVYLLRAMIKGLSGLIQIILSHEWPMTAKTAETMHDSGIVNVESLFDSSSRFGKLKEENYLLEARENLKSAISLYKSASVYLIYRIAEKRFFNLETEDLEQEEQFRQDLGHALASFDYQYDMNDSDESKIDVFHLGSFFSSKVDLSQVLPAPVGNKFESSEISDPTFGGLLPYWTSDTLKGKMQKADLLATDSIEGAKAVSGTSNWNQSNWLGYFYLPARTDTGNFWMYHAYLGWVYLSSSSPSDIWLFQETTNAWLWTKKSTFPFLYDNTAKAWLYLTSSGELMKWNGEQWDEQE